MKPIRIIRGIAAALPLSNVDTDQIIPARFMSRTRVEGYGEQCFHDLRFDSQGQPKGDFPLNVFRQRPTILVTGSNFGCGSSREAAVYALLDYGIQAVVAPSFADIFGANAGKNGLLTIVLPEAIVENLLVEVNSGTEVAGEVSLSAQRLRIGSVEANFDVDAQLKYKLMNGLDELSATMANEEAIIEFEKQHLPERSWRIPAAPV